METFSLTFGDQAENHHGMQRLGSLAPQGFSRVDFDQIPSSHKRIFDLRSLLSPSHQQQQEQGEGKEEEEEEEEEGEEGEEEEEGKGKGKGKRKGEKERGGKEEIPPAYLAVVPNGIDRLLREEGAADRLLEEMKSLPIDKMGLMRGRVVHKLARWNNCVAETAQEPDYQNGKGTVVPFEEVPTIRRIREALPGWFGPKAENLLGETNHYYDVRKCGIGFHGDSERRIVICGRVGAEMPLEFQWFREGAPVGRRFRLNLRHGDLYAMSEKATGFDWRRRKVLTLRHAAGADKFLRVSKN